MIKKHFGISMKLVRKVIGWLLGFVFFMCFSLICAAAPEEPDIYAEAAALIDGETGRVLWQKNGERFRANASTTKILTCILTLENCEPEETVEVSAYAASMPKVKLNMKPGDCFTVEQLLYSIMLESHNDSAVALAEHVIGKIEGEKEGEITKHTREESLEAMKKFSTLLNRKAKSIGCDRTFFVTPNGLDGEWIEQEPDGVTSVKEHGTNAIELARLLRYCCEESSYREKFLEITGTRSYAFCENQKKYAFYNRNALLEMLDGARSGKTGFTQKAGYCYVGNIVRADENLYLALLGCGWPGNRNYKWHDCKKLIAYAETHLRREKIPQMEGNLSEQICAPIEVRGGEPNVLGQKAFTKVEFDKDWLSGKSILLKDNERISIEIEKKTYIDAPVFQGEILGEIRLCIGDVTVEKQQLRAKNSVLEKSFFHTFFLVLDNFINI